MAIDPICKMEVDEDSAVYVSEYNDKKYYFCSQFCKMDFDKQPGILETYTWDSEQGIFVETLHNNDGRWEIIK